MMIVAKFWSSFLNKFFCIKVEKCYAFIQEHPSHFCKVLEKWTSLKNKLFCRNFEFIPETRFIGVDFQFKHFD